MENNNMDIVALLGLIIGLVAGFAFGLIGMAIATVLMALVAGAERKDILPAALLTLVGGLLGMGITFVLLL